MKSKQVSTGDAYIHVRNIGGIRETDVTIEPGVTVLAGRNATNRTSLLQACMAALGSDDASLKGDAEEGTVDLTIDGSTYTRRLERAGRTIQTAGDPYLDDSTLADLFAFLLESNDARRAVTRESDLREVLLRPVDTGEIEAEIDRLKNEKRELKTELANLESARRRLTDLEQKRTTLESKIEEKREELESVRETIETADVDVEETKTEKSALDEKLAELRELQSSLEDLRFNLETERESLATLREERKGLTDEQSALPEDTAVDIDDIDDEVSHLHSRLQSMNSTTRQLQEIIQFNEETLEGRVTNLRAELGLEEQANSVPDRLLEGTETVTCWTCGSDVNRSAIEETVEDLRSLHQERLDERAHLQSRIDDLQERRRDFQEQQERRSTIRRKLESLEREAADREQTIERLTDRRDELEDEIEDIEADVDDLESQEYSDILDLNKQANQLEYQLGGLERDLDDTTEEIETIQQKLGRESDLDARLGVVESDIEDQRTRIERLERDAIDAFNDHMETVLEILDYRNLERIWIERTEQTVQEGRRKVDRPVFVLHVVRQSESGATYEDTLEHLSESEREVTGLIFALAGYLVHEVHEIVPFMLLDSLEALDSERIALLVDYLREHVGYLVVALLPEDAEALDDRYRRIAEI